MLALLFPKRTVAPEAKLLPKMLTAVPPVVVPNVGNTEPIVGPNVGVIAIDSFCTDEVFPALSPTLTLKAKGLPVALDGVPLMAPEEAFSAKPGGNVPALTVQLL